MSEVLEQFEQKRIELDKEFIDQYRELNRIISLNRKQYTCEHCGKISNTIENMEIFQESRDKAAELRKSFNISFHKIELDYMEERNQK